MNIHEILNQPGQSEIALASAVEGMRRKLEGAMNKSPECRGGVDNHEYEALFDDTSAREDGDLFRLRSFLKARSYVAIGLESANGNRTLVLPHDSKHAIVTDIPILVIKKEGFPVDNKADLNVLEQFSPAIDLLIRVMNGVTEGSGLVEAKWIAV